MKHNRVHDWIKSATKLCLFTEVSWNLNYYSQYLVCSTEICANSSRFPALSRQSPPARIIRTTRNQFSTFLWSNTCAQCLWVSRVAYGFGAVKRCPVGSYSSIGWRARTLRREISHTSSIKRPLSFFFFSSSRHQNPINSFYYWPKLLLVQLGLIRREVWLW